MFDRILDTLRSTESDVHDKKAELSDARSEIDDAISELDDFEGRLADAIDTIEGLSDLSVSYSFSYEVSDFDISPV